MSNKQKQNIKVAIKIRPLLKKEKKDRNFIIVRREGNTLKLMDPVEIDYRKRKVEMIDVYHRSRETEYRFDYIYEKESMKDIFRGTAESLVDGLVQGYNACVFAYGATGTGKTYTMMQQGKYGGLNGYCLKNIFEKVEGLGSQLSPERVKITLKYVEIYNE